MTSQRVLLIDDDVVLLRQMANALVSAGYSVQAAPDGALGLARFRTYSPHLVISDLIMPTREGIETIMSLRNESPGLKTIAISGGYRLGPDDFLNLARHVGADEVLAKPFRLADLVALVKSLLARPAVADAADAA